MTFLLTFILILLAAAALGIGKLLTGKNKLSCKRCGNPEKKKNCEICNKKKKP